MPLRRSLVSLAGAILALSPFSAGAATIKVLNPSSSFATGGVGKTDWTDFTADLNSTFSTVQYAALNASSILTGADAFFINLPAGNVTYTTAERNNITAILNSGIPTVILTESWGWRFAGAQLATIVGGTYTGEDYNSVIPESPHALTAGLTFYDVYFNLSGAISGGTQIFGDVISAWGSRGSFVIIGDVDVLDDDALRGYGNQIFANNLLTFLSTPAIPEPGSALLLAAGAVITLRRRR